MSLRCETRGGRSCLGSFLPARDCVLWSRVFAFEYNNDVPIFSLWDEN